jgi:alkylated DNA repair dioxygenase AlkB
MMDRQFSLWEYQNTLEDSESKQKTSSQVLLDLDGEVIMYSHLFDRHESDEFFLELSEQIAWEQDRIKIFGKEVLLPRLTAWYGDRDKIYTYSGIEMIPKPWISTLLLLKAKIEPIAGVEFNSVLLNLYRDGNDYVSWHSDDEPELGENPIIGSVSFGETRQFIFRHKYKKDLDKVKVDLNHGSFLLMKGKTQEFWQHYLPKRKKVTQPRINLTFRSIE